MVVNPDVEKAVLQIVREVTPFLNEKQTRILEGSAAKVMGYGGITSVSQNINVSRNTVASGMKIISTDEVEETSATDSAKSRIRRPGGGRKKVSEKIPELNTYIETIITENGDTYGSPESPLRWTSWSLRKIADKLDKKYGIHVSPNIVSRSLDELGYSKQLNQKMCQLGVEHPDRDAQFSYINDKSNEFISANFPVISVDTKKKENIGNFKNNGAEYCPKHNPRKVLDHDFPIKELGKVSPYGVYVLNNNTGFINLGTSHDTPEFAGESISLWWDCIGKNTFPNASKLFITCDSGGSNGCRTWLWKAKLQDIANSTGLEIHVSHFPPGTSKWNKIEHRLFCYISKNWQGKPLIDIETVVNLIGSTTTKKGLKVVCKVDNRTYDTGKKITDEEKDALNMDFVGPNKEWNYIIKPNNQLIS
ncbi:MAG TPA: ISAzo13 family transposase [Methanocorpusculum sp.]|nr:ISAzo13 family transposase [Methanocorpusculum sp.]